MGGWGVWCVVWCGPGGVGVRVVPSGVVRPGGGETGGVVVVWM